MLLYVFSLHVNTGLFAVSPLPRRSDSCDDTFKLFVGLDLIGANYQIICDCDLNLVSLMLFQGRCLSMKKPHRKVGFGCVLRGWVQPRALALATTLSTVKPNFSMRRGPGAEAP